MAGHDAPEKGAAIPASRWGHTLFEFACTRSGVLRSLTKLNPRAVRTTVVFQGYRRDAVQATLRLWVSSNCTNDTVKFHVPGASLLRVLVGRDYIEAYLESATSSDVRHFVCWILNVVSSRHCIHGSHLVVIHSAERCGTASLLKLGRHPGVVLLLSTTHPDSTPLVRFGCAMRVRVPCLDISRVPGGVVAELESATAAGTVASIRGAVHKLSCIGFLSEEIVRFAAYMRGVGVDECELLAKLSHVAAQSSGVCERATEASVASSLLKWSHTPCRPEGGT